MGKEEVSRQLDAWLRVGSEERAKALSDHPDYALEVEDVEVIAEWLARHREELVCGNQVGVAYLLECFFQGNVPGTFELYLDVLARDDTPELHTRIAGQRIRYVTKPSSEQVLHQLFLHLCRHLTQWEGDPQKHEGFCALLPSLAACQSDEAAAEMFRRLQTVSPGGLEDPSHREADALVGGFMDWRCGSHPTRLPEVWRARIWAWLGEKIPHFLANKEDTCSHVWLYAVLTAQADIPKAMEILGPAFAHGPGLSGPAAYRGFMYWRKEYGEATLRELLATMGAEQGERLTRIWQQEIALEQKRKK